MKRSFDPLPSPLYKELQRPVYLLLSLYPSSVFPFRSLDLDSPYRYPSLTSPLARLFQLCTSKQFLFRHLCANTPPLALYAGFYEVDEYILRIQRPVLNGRAYVVRSHCPFYVGYSQSIKSKPDSNLQYLLSTY